MSQSQNSTVLNGPSGELTMAFKDAQQGDVNKVSLSGNPQQPIQQQQYQQLPPGVYPRPPLQRVDSRANLQQRFPYPPGAQFRPPPQQQQPLQQPQYPQQFQQPPQFQRPPFNNQPQFRPQTGPQPPLQRNPIPIQRPQQPPILRPAGAPLPRQRPPGLQTQRSFQALPVQNLDPPVEPPQHVEAEPQKVVAVSEPAPPTQPQPPNAVPEQPSPPPRPESRAEEILDEKTVPPSSLSLKADDEKHSNTPSPQPDSVIENKPPKHPERRKAPKTPSPSKSKTKEGDNDSGVDESTQGNDHSSNGDAHSPRKSARSRLATPTKNRSFSRGSASPHLKSPDSNPGTPGPGDKKKIPMNRVQVGSAPSPNLKVVKSKIGSLANTSYKPGGGNVKIEHKKIDLSHAQSKIGAKNDTYAPSGGDKKILHQKLQWNAKSKIGSLENTAHTPKGGEKKIESVKLNFKDKAKPKVGSKDNMKHVPGGGDIKIENRKLNIQVESKVGSMENVKHRPGGGDKKIFDDKDYLRQKSGLSNDNLSVSGSQMGNGTVENGHSGGRHLETVPEGNAMDSRPSSRLSRGGSLRRKLSSGNTPRTPWKT